MKSCAFAFDTRPDLLQSHAISSVSEFLLTQPHSIGLSILAPKLNVMAGNPHTQSKF